MLEEFDILFNNPEQMESLLEKVEHSADNILESIDTLVPDSLLEKGSKSRELAVLGAGISLPIFLGIGIHRYLSNRQKLKEKIPFCQLNNGGNIISRVFYNHNIKYIFSLNEYDTGTIADGCFKNKIKIINMKDFNNCISAASGIYRITGQVGVVLVPAGPEMLSLINGVINSNLENIPIIVIGIKPALSQHSFFDKNLISKYFKWTRYINSIYDISGTLEKSFNEAQYETPGSVYLELSQDLLLPEDETKELYDTIQQQRWYFNRLWSNMTLKYKYPNDDYEISFHYPKKRQVYTPNSRHVEEVLRLLLDSKNPVLVIGDQCIVSNHIENKDLNIESLKLSIKLLGIPTYLFGFSKTLGSNECTNLVHDNFDYATQMADLILICGVPSPTFLSELRINYKNTTVITLDENPYPLAHEGIAGSGIPLLDPVYHYNYDPSAFLLHLSFIYPKQHFGKWKNWLYDLREKDSIGTLIESKKSEARGEHLNPYLLTLSLRETFHKMERPPIIVSDVSNFADKICVSLGDCLNSHLQQSRLSNNGSSIGLAIASKLCFPDVDVWMICDERSISRSIQEFETLSRYHIPINIVVGNNDKNSLLANKDDHLFNQQHPVANQLHIPRTAFHKVMSAFGGKGFILSHSDSSKEDIEKSFHEARDKSNATQKPVLINCWIDQPKQSLIGSGSM
eukprot:gene3324-4165_t